MNHKILVLLTIFFISCGSSPDVNDSEINILNNHQVVKSSEESKWDKELQKYLDLIPEIKLPLHFVCERGFDIPNLNYENELIKKFKPEGAIIIGKLYQDHSEAAIVYGYSADIFYPLISVIDDQGIELREIRFFDLGDCVDDIGYSATTRGTISTDFKINTITEKQSWNSEDESPEKKTEVIKGEISINKK